MLETSMFYEGHHINIAAVGAGWHARICRAGSLTPADLVAVADGPDGRWTVMEQAMMLLEHTGA